MFGLTFIFSGDSIVWWTEKHAGYELRLIAVVIEWILAFCIFAYIWTFTKEIRSIEYQDIVFKTKVQK